MSAPFCSSCQHGMDAHSYESIAEPKMRYLGVCVYAVTFDGEPWAKDACECQGFNELVHALKQ